MSASLTGRPPQRRVRVRRRRQLLVLAIAALLALGAIETYRMAIVARQMNQGRSSLQRGQEVLETKRLDATSDELAEARRAFESAQRSFASAHAMVRRDPVMWIGGRAPVVSTQARAFNGLAEIGEEAGAIGAAGVEAADQVAQVRAEGEGTLLEKSLEALDRTRAPFDVIEQRLTTIDALREPIADDALLPPLSSAFNDFDARRDRLSRLVETYGDAERFLPAFLGFDRPKCYLVLAQNDAELLPTGGLVSVIGLLCLDRGAITTLEFTDAVEFGLDWMRATGAYQAPPAALDRYLLKGVTWNLTVSNWSPDFPTAAREAERFYSLGGGGQVDGVIGINVRTLEHLLAITGPVPVPEYDAVATTGNVFELTEKYTRDPSQPEADRKEFVALLAHNVLDRALHPRPGGWSQFLDLLQQLGEQKELLIYPHDEGQQEIVRNLGLSGEVRYDGGDFIMLVDASVNGTKLNAVVEQSLDIDARIDSAGAAHNTLTIDYFNNLAPWEAGRDPSLARKLMLGGVYGDYARLYVPPQSAIVDVRDQQGSVGLEEYGSELGLTVFGRFFTVDRDARRQLTFEYVTPPVVGVEGSSAVYRLTLRKQAGQHAMPVVLHVTPPEGMRLAGLTINGEPAGLSPDGVRFDLSIDYVIEYGIERTGA